METVERHYFIARDADGNALGRMSLRAAMGPVPDAFASAYDDEREAQITADAFGGAVERVTYFLKCGTR